MNEIESETEKSETALNGYLQDKNGKKKKSISIKSIAAALILVVALAAAGIYFYIDYRDQWIITNNASIDGRIHTISSTVPGRVSKIVVDENVHVSKGELLLEIDSTLQDLSVQKINAAIEAHNLTIAVLGDYSGPEFEMARARPRELKILLEEAEYLLQQFRILSPADGYVANRLAEAGEYVLPGQPLMSVVNLEDLWVVANFTEEQIKYLNQGQEVNIYIDAFPDEQLRGRVADIMPAGGAVFSLFPPEATAANWVRVAQRIPVRITFEDALPENMRLRQGMLARVRVTR
ncbi:MAG: HlyD family secretion protein [Firmicutes bacterium]|nr:HlyD family secretion protein [Bacillota bacterium]MCL5993353.1 HlyD family secretion protein [Bacillota bacterium]